jgi:hypothetical protein
MVHDAPELMIHCWLDCPEWAPRANTLLSLGAGSTVNAVKTCTTSLFESATATFADAAGLAGAAVVPFDLASFFFYCLSFWHSDASWPQILQ